MAEFNPGSADISKALVTNASGKSKDIASIIVSFELEQSLDLMSYSGKLKILDGIGFMETFPLRGEEQIDLKISSMDLGTEKNLKAQVFRIDSIVPSESGGQVLYTMHFISKISYNAFKRKITKSYSKKSMDQIAKIIFDTYFSKLGEKDYLDKNDRTKTLSYAAYRMPIIDEPDRSFYIQPTANLTDIIIPDYMPTEAMQFIQNLSFQPETPSASFKFFETLDNFYYVTDEYLIKSARRKDLVDLFYSPASSIDPRKPDDQINRIEKLEVASKGLNTASDIISGGYTSKVTEIDLIRKKIVPNNFNYDKNAGFIDMSGNSVDLQDDPHSEVFRKETFTEENARNFFVFKNYNQNGDIPGSLHVDRFIPTIVSNKLSYQHHLNQTTVAASMKGRLDIAPGMVVNLSVKGLDGLDAPESNKTLSGKYLVHTVRHSRDDSGTLGCALKLIKYGWSKGIVNE